MAGLFDTTNDPMAQVMAQRQKANQALGSPYGKYGGIVQAGGMFADTMADAIAGGGYGSSDPTIQKSTELKKIVAVVSQQFPGQTNTPDFYKAVALAVQDKYPEKAQEAMDKARQIEQEQQKAKLTGLQIEGEQSKLDEDKAAKDAEAKGLQTRQSASSVLFPDSPQELRDAIAADKQLFSTAVTEKLKVKDTKTKLATAGGRVLLIDEKGNTIKDLGAAPAQAKTTVEVNLGDKGAAAYGAKVGGLVAEQDVALVNSATTAGESLPKIQDTLTLLKKGDPTTGIGADVINNIDRVKSQFLADKKAGKRVTDTQVLDALLGSEVFPMIGALGIGARGLDTPAEREFLRGVFTGTIQMNKETLIKLTETRMKIAERAVKKYNDMLDRGDLNNYQESQGRKLRRIELPTQQPGMQTTSSGTSYQIVED